MTARKNAWIVKDMWRLVNMRVSMILEPAQDQSLVRCLGRTINTSLKSYWRQRTEDAGWEIETLVDADPPSTRKPGTR